jgi:hypothetical protein
MIGNLEPLESHMFNKGTAEDSDMKTQRLDELKELDKIRVASRKCDLVGISEAAWNCEVHSRVLRLAVESFVDVEQHNVYGRWPILFPISCVNG